MCGGENKPAASATYVEREVSFRIVRSLSESMPNLWQSCVRSAIMYEGEDHVVILSEH